MLTKPKQGRRDESMLVNVEMDYDDELERKTPILIIYQIQTRINHLLQLFNQIRRLDDPRRPITAGVCWEAPNINWSLALPILNQILTRYGMTKYLLLNQMGPPGLIWYTCKSRRFVTRLARLTN